MQSRYMVQNYLSDDALFRVGCYLQTCAYIEHTVWWYYFVDNPVDPKDERKKAKIMKLRLHTSDLIKAVRQHAEHVPNDEAELIESMLSDVEVGMQTRHSIVHGAISETQTAGQFRLYHHWMPDRKVDQFVEYAEPIDISVIEEAIKNAESLLERALELVRRAMARHK